MYNTILLSFLYQKFCCHQPLEEQHSHLILMKNKTAFDMILIAPIDGINRRI